MPAGRRLATHLFTTVAVLSLLLLRGRDVDAELRTFGVYA